MDNSRFHGIEMGKKDKECMHNSITQEYIDISYVQNYADASKVDYHMLNQGSTSK